MNQRWTMWLGGVAGAAVLLAIGCTNLSLSAEAKDQWTRHYTLAKGGTLELRNTNGRIEIAPAEGDTIDVVATRIARAMSDEGARDALRRLDITESVTSDRVALDGTTHGAGLEINVSREIDFTVHVPRWAALDLSSTNGEILVSDVTGGLRAHTTNGGVTGTGLAGPSDVRTTNGTVKLAFAAFGPTDDLTCHTTNGTIHLTLPSGAQASISATVTNGAIRTEGLDLRMSEQSKRRLEGTLGSGGAHITLGTTNGAIVIDE